MRNIMWQMITESGQREAWVKSIKADGGIGAGNRNKKIYEGYGEFVEARVPMTDRRRLVPAWRTSSDHTRRGAVPICLTRFVDSMGSGWRCDV